MLSCAQARNEPLMRFGLPKAQCKPWRRAWCGISVSDPEQACESHFVTLRACLELAVSYILSSPSASALDLADFRNLGECHCATCPLPSFPHTRHVVPRVANQSLTIPMTNRHPVILSHSFEHYTMHPALSSLFCTCSSQRMRHVTYDILQYRLNTSS
jgi:hypothetical protein